MTDEPESVGIGHNNPPAPTREEQFSDILKDVEDLAKKGSALPLKVEGPEDLEQYQEVIRAAKKKADDIDTRRKAANQPFTDEIKENNRFLGARVERLNNMISILKKAGDVYLDAEEQKEKDRLAKEAQERQAAIDAEREKIEAAKAAGGIDAEMADEREARLEGQFAAAQKKATSSTGPVKTGAGTVSRRKSLDFRVGDYDEVDLNQLRGSFTVDAIDKAIRAHIKQHKKTKPIKGVEIFETSNTSYR